MNNSEIININGPFKGEIEVPGDKSMTHRAIMLASLAKGISTIYELNGRRLSTYYGYL